MGHRVCQRIRAAPQLSHLRQIALVSSWLWYDLEGSDAIRDLAVRFVEILSRRHVDRFFREPVLGHLIQGEVGFTYGLFAGSKVNGYCH
jgi:hypothetical protein